MRAYNVDAVRSGLLALIFLAVCGAAAAEVRNPNGVAVIIGNKDYQHKDVPPVAYAHRDAEAFKRHVLDVLGYDPDNVFDLRDADRAAMFKALGRRGGTMSDLWAALARLPEGGDLVVYYSGHGVPGREGGKGYLLPVNVAPGAAEADGYPLDLLYEKLGSLDEARSVRVFLDACFSGGSHAGFLVQGASPVAMSAEMPVEASDKVTVLAAAEGSQLASWDEEAGHGLFTHHLLDALYGKGDRDRDGRVTASEARAYLDAHMSSAAWLSHGREQKAVLLEAAGAEVVLASAEGGVFPARPVLGPVGETEEAGAEQVRAEEAHVSPEKVERDLGLSVGIRRLAQMGLAVAGHDPGPADGVFGRRTRSALRAWQASKNLEVTGYLTKEQSEGLAALGREESERRAPEERQRTKAVEPDEKGTVSSADTPGGAVSGVVGGLARDALHRAAEAGDVNGLQAALAAGADVNARDGKGWTALMHAVAKGYPVLAGLLLEAEASPDVRAPHGATALFMAAADGHTENIVLLMEAGADVSFRGPGSRTAVDVARERYGDVETARRGGEPAAVLALLEGMSLDDAAFAQAKAAGTAVAFEGYLSSYPEGRHAREATDAVRRVRAEAERKQRADDDAAFARAEAEGTAAAYARYRSSYPEGRHVEAAERREEERRAGRQFRDCVRCPKMVVVPPGTYMMGSPPEEERRDYDEGPVHRVTIARPFAVGVYEVTFREWDACVAGGGCGGYRPDDEGWGRGNRPVVNVSWEDAKGYVEWLSRKTGEEYRLLSESEWEYVARAGTTRPFHTGATIVKSQANYGWWEGYRRTTPVGKFRANGFGLHDVHGNVREWVEDCPSSSYEGAPEDGSAWESGSCYRRVLRGGSWNDLYSHELRSANREDDTANSRLLGENVGFRVARTLTP